MVYTLFTITTIIIGITSPASAGLLSPVEKYQMTQPVKILIVPGHDNEFSGAKTDTLREADVNLKLAGYITDELAKDMNLQVTMSRDKTTGQYIPELEEYFTDHENDIAEFIAEHKKSYAKQQKKLAQENGGAVEPKQVPHGNANPTIAYRLYGTNKWANEQGFDLILHVHFNDTWPRGGAGGEYGGYSLYVPGRGLPNQATSNVIGNAIGGRLRDILPKSNLSLESQLSNDVGVIADTKLIALGSYATLQVPSVLIEYSYIYEPHVANQFWNVMLPSMSRATILGLYDYLLGQRSTASTFKHFWAINIMPSIKDKKSDVVAIQMGLRSLGLYPPEGKTQTDCPMTGAYGPCTKSAVTAFQKKYYLQADGLFGKNTRAAMNGFFGI